VKVTCIYTIERAARPDAPLAFGMDIPFGISIIATVLQRAGHAVSVLVFSSGNGEFQDVLRSHLLAERPRLVCLTAVSTQYPFVQRIADLVKRVHPTAFVVLGGHHASLNPEETVTNPNLDAICVGEGDRSVVELAERVANDTPVQGIPHLWSRRSDGSIERNAPLPFDQDLDALPYIDRAMWDPWIAEPHRFPSVLLGRGCPFRCTYCSSHGMQQLSTGTFVRLRSPANVIGEIEGLCRRHPSIDNVYLEVETIAHQREADALFTELAAWNSGRQAPLRFGLNFTVTSTFIRDDTRCRQFLSLLRGANVTYLNIGLESGSEHLRRAVLRRPRYSNEEFLRFAALSRAYGIALDFYVLIGVPGETASDYRETVALVRQAQPAMVFLSIYHPYPGTDLYRVAVEQGLLPRERVDVAAERARSVLALPAFPRWLIRAEYVLFWWRVFRGRWSMARILVETAKAAIAGSPRLWPIYQRVQWHSAVFRFLRARYRAKVATGEALAHLHRPEKIDFSWVD
jgi:radical SAM superfamily enzyme YgiQ (UPF0313 family)